MSDRTNDSSSADRRARLRRRLVGGVFTALVAIDLGGSQLAMASTPKPQDEGAAPTIQARAEQVRVAQSEMAARADADPASPAWGNGWYNWRNGWNNWHNNWNNWNNLWNNWSNGWNNWNNWNNTWYNF